MQNWPNTLLFEGGKEIAPEIEKIARDLIGPSHSDLYTLSPAEKSGLHSIEEIRFLIQEAYKSPFEGKAKVFLLLEAEKMAPVAANALLKTLEEPLLTSYFFLQTARPDQLLPTIASRATCHPSFPSSFSISPDLDQLIDLIERQDFWPESLSSLTDGEGILRSLLLLARDQKAKELGRAPLLKQTLKRPLPLEKVLPLVQEASLALSRNIRLPIVLNHYLNKMI
jgi:hypothetical protein